MGSEYRVSPIFLVSWIPKPGVEKLKMVIHRPLKNNPSSSETALSKYWSTPYVLLRGHHFSDPVVAELIQNHLRWSILVFSLYFFFLFWFSSGHWASLEFVFFTYKSNIWFWKHLSQVKGLDKVLKENDVCSDVAGKTNTAAHSVSANAIADATLTSVI